MVEDRKTPPPPALVLQFSTDSRIRAAWTPEIAFDVVLFFFPMILQTGQDYLRLSDNSLRDGSAPGLPIEVHGCLFHERRARITAEFSWVRQIESNIRGLMLVKGMFQGVGFASKKTMIFG